MHRGHDHHHLGDGAGAGHNQVSPPRAAQWQTPHLPHANNDHHHHNEADLDLVEMAFVEGFGLSRDPVSFLRLAHIPFEATDDTATRLVLLRVETDSVVDVGGLSPQLGGGEMRYDPLPARMVSHRRRLRFMYFDGKSARSLTLGEVRALKEATSNL